MPYGIIARFMAAMIALAGATRATPAFATVVEVPAPEPTFIAHGTPLSEREMEAYRSRSEALPLQASALEAGDDDAATAAVVLVVVLVVVGVVVLIVAAANSAERERERRRRRVVRVYY